MLAAANIADQSVRLLEDSLGECNKFAGRIPEHVLATMEEEACNLKELRSIIIRAMVDVDGTKNQPWRAWKPDTATVETEPVDDIPF